jgi:glycosyltransferase involved in cell wall biosynthesis
MKVALIDVNCKHSSTGKIVYDLYTELNNNGHEAAVYYGRGPKIKEKNIFKFGIDLETYFHAFMTRITGLTGVYSPISTWRLIRKLKKFKPDIVHIHELHAYFINLKSIMNYLKKAPLKVIWTFHCEFMFTGKCAITYDCNKWQTECHKCPQVKEYPKSLVFDFSNPMFRQKKALFDNFNNLTIVTPPKWLESKVKLSFLRDKQVAVIPNGIDQNIFKPTDYKDLNIYPLIKDKKLILSVAADIMSENKGGHRILEIASDLVDKKEIIFVLVGTKKPANVNHSNVIFLERTKNQTELAKLYTAAEAYLIVSKSENYPTTCLEALSCGTPIIGYDVGGTKETASKGFGYFTEYGNKNEINNYIKSLMLKPHDKKVIVKTYSFLHSKDRMLSDYIKVYNENFILR